MGRGTGRRRWLSWLVAAVALTWGTPVHAENQEVVPSSAPGLQVVQPAEVAARIKAGGRLIDTRSINDFLASRIPGALHIAYRERSVRRPVFDATQDDIPGFLNRLNHFVAKRDTPIIFYCNGLFCWKSYKASIAAVQDGYRSVEWFRGGLAEWLAAGYPADSE
jgi:rhodanese-related sulfurtransferase